MKNFLPHARRLLFAQFFAASTAAHGPTRCFSRTLPHLSSRNQAHKPAPSAASNVAQNTASNTASNTACSRVPTSSASPHRRWGTLRSLVWGLSLVCALGTPAARAVLPVAVDGEALPSLAPMLETVTPAVVNISTRGHVEVQTNPLLNDPFFRRFFNVPDQPRQRETQALGSGVIIDSERGVVLTNNHVIANADEITVTLRDGRKLEATLVGTDPETDVAVLRVEAQDLTAVALADSDASKVGDFVVAIGNPFGLGQTVTSGIISALARSGLGIIGYEDYIQTDASINPGNSGGALVNLRGELVGINTAIFSRSGGNIGIGFAIPANMAMQITEQLLEHGEVKRGLIGAQLQDLDADLAEAFGLDAREGAVLVNILPDSPAEAAGLEAGDVVVAINDEPVASAADLRNKVALMRIGQQARLDVLRNGRKRSFVAEIASREQFMADAGGEPHNPRLAGVTLGAIAEDAPAFGRVNGVMVYGIDPASPAARAGLREADIITSVNRQQISDVETFMQVVDRTRGQLLLRVIRGNSAAFLVIK